MAERTKIWIAGKMKELMKTDLCGTVCDCADRLQAKETQSKSDIILLIRLPPRLHRIQYRAERFAKDSYKIKTADFMGRS